MVYYGYSWDTMGKSSAMSILTKYKVLDTHPYMEYNGAMINFKQMIQEDKGGKNLHLEHLEDEILNYGVDGGRAAINFLRSLRDMMAGATRSSVNMTVKWDTIHFSLIRLSMLSLWIVILAKRLRLRTLVSFGTQRTLVTLYRT